MCTYLDQVGSTYYFRRIVPAELRPYLLTATGKPRAEFKPGELRIGHPQGGSSRSYDQRAALAWLSQLQAVECGHVFIAF
jgi:hypothetical protein